MQKILYSLFFNQLCISLSPIQTKSKSALTRGRGLQEQSHYKEFHERFFETDVLQDGKSYLTLPENRIFILEKGNYKIMAHFQKKSLGAKEDIYKFIGEDTYFLENPMVLQFFTNSENAARFMKNEHLFVIQMLCPEISFLEQVFDGGSHLLDNKNEKITGGRWLKMASRIDTFFLDLSQFEKPLDEPDFIRQVSKILKTGLRLCNSFLMLVPCFMFQNVFSFAELLDDLFIDDSLFALHRSYLCDMQLVDDRFYVIKYGKNTNFTESDQMLFLNKELIMEDEILSSFQNCDRLLLQLFSRIGLRKAVHFFSQAQYEFNSLRDYMPKLPLISVFIRILYKEKILSRQEISKFRAFLQNLSFFEDKSAEKTCIRISLLRMNSSLSMMSDSSIENERTEPIVKRQNNVNEELFLNGISPPKKVKPSLFESKLSPSKNNIPKPKSVKKIIKELAGINEFKFNDDIIMLPMENIDSRSSSSLKKRKLRSSQKLIKSKPSFLKAISPHSGKNELSFSGAKEKLELCYSSYTEESVERSQSKEEELRYLKRSFDRNGKMFLTRQHSL